MNRKKLLAHLFIYGIIIFILSCTKAGPGGSGTIKGNCFHHTKIIPFDTVYIKYDAKELPGVRPGDYDAHVYADKNGYFIFNPLKKGYYYLYGFGFDTSLAKTVTGGLPVRLKSNSDEQNVVLPVTEGD